MKELLKQLIEQVIGKILSNSRIGYWDEGQKAIVIYDPKNIDKGTVFIPSVGKTYFHNLD